MRVSCRQLAVVLLYLAASLSPLYSAFVSQRVGGYPRIEWDGGFFQHAGWYSTEHGAILYVDIWDVKPPFAIETTALFAWLVNGDMLALHLISIAVTMLAAIGILLLIEHWAYEQTQSPYAGLAAVLFLLAFPTFRYSPVVGFGVKHCCLFFGLLSVRLKQRGYPFWAGVAAAMSAGYWQMGLLFCLLLLPSKRAVVGGLLAAALIVLPIVLQGAGKEMIEQAVFSHLLVGEGKTIGQRLWWLLPMLPYHAALLPFAVWGLAKSPRWLQMGVAWFTIQIVFFDLDGKEDLVTWLGLLAVPFAICQPRWSMAMVIPFFILGMVLPGRMAGVPNSTYHDPKRNNLPSVDVLYWEQVIPETCHYRLSQLERQWIEEFGSEC